MTAALKKKEAEFLAFPEKRHHQRLSINLGVGILINGKKLNVVTENISCGGMYLPVKKTDLENPSKEIEMVLSLPDNEKPVKLIGEIARIDKSTHREGVAIQFKGLYDENRMAIDRFVKNKMH